MGYLKRVQDLLRSLSDLQVTLGTYYNRNGHINHLDHDSKLGEVTVLCYASPRLGNEQRPLVFWPTVPPTLHYNR